MKERLCVGDAGKKGAHGGTVAAGGRVVFSDDLVTVKPIGLEDGAGE